MTHQHTNRDGGRKETVNWLEVRIPGDGTYPMDRISRGGWHDGSSRHATLELFDPRRAAFDSLRVLAWTGYVDQAAAGLDILMHPHRSTMRRCRPSSGICRRCSTSTPRRTTTSTRA